MRRAHAIGFLIFCCLSGSSWLLDNAHASELPSLEQQALHDLVIALTALGFLAFRPRRGSAKELPFFDLATAGILLLGLPALLSESASVVSTRSGVSLYALAPLLLVLGAAAFPSSASAPQQGRSLMLPALVGFAGTLLLPSFQFPSNVHSSLLFATVILAIISTAAGSLWLHSLLRDADLVPAIALVSVANAIFLSIAALLTHPIPLTGSLLLPEILRSLFLSLPEVGLLIWLLREVDPVRLGTRFFFVPLLSVLEGLLVVRPPFDPRLLVALILMSLGGGILLFTNPTADSEAPPDLGLR